MYCLLNQNFIYLNPEVLLPPVNIYPPSRVAFEKPVIISTGASTVLYPFASTLNVVMESLSPFELSVTFLSVFIILFWYRMNDPTTTKSTI